MSHTYTNLLTHIIFSTRDRVPSIKSDFRPQLHAYLGGIVRELKGTALIINGTADHVHLLVGLPPALALSDAMRVLKTTRPVGLTTHSASLSAGRPDTARSASANRTC
ncbi:MAG: IS200/IS605 family transposase [Pyrinomonadaceae bacterium]